MKALGIFVLILSLTGIILTVLDMIPVYEYKVYNCELAEFHPDYPKDVREECRKLRTNKKYITV